MGVLRLLSLFVGKKRFAIMVSFKKVATMDILRVVALFVGEKLLQ